MDFYELSSSRRSIRSYLDRDVPKDELVKLIEAAQSAPSAGNCQPWHFFVVKDKDLKAKIVEKAYNQNWMLTAPAFIIVCADIQRTTPRYGDRGRNLYCLQDTAAAVQNILLCAKSMGLGTCWVGAFDEEGVRQVLDLKEDVPRRADLHPVAIIPVGYPASESGTLRRRPIGEIVTFIGEEDTASVKERAESPRKIEHCDMSETVFNDVNLKGVSFSDINFCEVDICDANLTDGAIHSCNLTNFKIFDCKIDGMTVNGVDISNLIK